MGDALASRPHAYLHQQLLDDHVHGAVGRGRDLDGDVAEGVRDDHEADGGAAARSNLHLPLLAFGRGCGRSRGTDALLSFSSIARGMLSLNRHIHK